MIIPQQAIDYIKCHRSEIKKPYCENYIKDVEKDFNEILPYLPGKLDSFLDIGCGLGGIDALLSDRYPEAEIVLLDEDGEPTTTFGYNPVYMPYTSRRLAEDIVARPVKWLDVGCNDGLKADLVLSLLSWGYHFPLSTYNPEYKHLVVDIRDGTCDVAWTFPGYKVIKKGENYVRIYHQNYSAK